MKTVAFEAYDEQFWISFEVQTAEPDVLIGKLLKLKNTRNIHIVRH